jgi:D-3-phosphoglycerate dehydrogenase
MLRIALSSIFHNVSFELRSIKSALRLNSEPFPATSAEMSALSTAGVIVTSTESIDSELAREFLPSIDALLLISARIKRDDIDMLKRCRVIVRYGSGTDNINVEYATEKGIVVTNVPDFCLSEVADHTMTLLLATAHKLILMDRHTRQGHWQAPAKETVHRISGKILGLVGFGKIAQEVARRASVFDLNVIAHDPFIDLVRAQSLEVRVVQLGELLQQADFVSLHVPLNKQTLHMIGEPELRNMKADSVLLNTSRGGLVDEAALVRALTEGWIGAAGIDVYESISMFDPNHAYVHHPIFDLDNVILTPHSAGTSVESLEQLKLAGAGEAIAVLGGRNSHNWVNPDVIPRFPMAVVAGQE